MQVTVECADVDAALPDRQTAVDGVTAGVAAPLAVDLGIVAPQLAAGGGIEHVDMTEVADGVHHPVDHDRGRLEPAVRSEVVLPGEAEPRDVAGIDVTERRVVRPGRVATGREPLIRLARR